MLTFALAYDAEMGRLPPEASELTRQLKHQEFLGLDEAVAPAVEAIDLGAILGPVPA